jgi:hypothetical protein
MFLFSGSATKNLYTFLACPVHATFHTAKECEFKETVTGAIRKFPLSKRNELM